MAWTAQQLQAEIARRKKQGLPYDGFQKQLKALNAAGATTITKKGVTAGAGSAPATGGPVNVQGATDLGINSKTGQINPGDAVGQLTGAASQDTLMNFNMNNPGTQTDAFGNSQNVTIDPVTGQTSINQTGGAGLNAANQAFLTAAGGIAGAGVNRQAAQDANYNYITKDYANRKKQEMDAAKQELANRGIPLDPSTESLYGRTLAEIDSKYQSLDDQAKNQAINAGNQTYSTDVGAVGTLGSTVQGMGPNFTPYAGSTSNQAELLANIMGTISDADMTKYGIDKDTMIKLKQIAASKSKGGGPGGSADSGPLLGGSAPGFGV